MDGVLQTTAEMRALEARAIESGEVSGLELMERAGVGVVAAIATEWPELGAGASATIVCGPGNNGGDGFVVARLLREAGWRVRVLAVPTIRRGPDATAARQRWKDTGGTTVPLKYDALRWPAEQEGGSDLYIDALLGIGARGPWSGEIGRTMAHWAGAGGDAPFFRPRTLAIDVPSGLCADSGRVPGVPSRNIDGINVGVPKARLTVTFDTPKPGHVLADGPYLCGKVVVADIGLANRRALAPEGKTIAPAGLTMLCGPAGGDPGPSPWPIWSVADNRTPMFSAGYDILAKRSGHKYDHGHVICLTGGMGHGGAARLAGRAALRVGAGAVTLACPLSAVIENVGRVDAFMVRRARDADAIRNLVAGGKPTAVCIGPGFGTGEGEADKFRAVLALCRPTVIDADAITLLATYPDLQDGLHDACVLTPHLGEFRRLAPDLAEEIADPDPPAMPAATFEEIAVWREEAEKARRALAAQRAPTPSKIDVTRAAAARFGCVVLLKGPDTVIADPVGRVSVNASVYDRAAPWLATAGAGDVLAGMITGLLARGALPFEAARLSAYLHSEAARAFGPGLIASDLPDQLPRVLRAVEADLARS